MSCKKKISEKHNFIIYPNGIKIHSNCLNSRSLSVCPDTNQNFEKTFRNWNIILNITF